MRRRDLLSLITLPALSWAQEKSKLKITGIRLVNVKPRKQPPAYTPAAGAWSTQYVEVANPMSIYPEFKARRELFFPNPGKVPSFTVEITTDKGITGYGNGGPGGGPVVVDHLAKLLMGRDGNDIEQHVEFGYTKLKLAIPHGPADGRAGMKANLALVERARKALGPDGEIMLDCWMAWTERYTIEMAEMMASQRVYWMEEVLQPHDYAGFGRLNAQIKSTRIATGEHEYGRYGFRYLLEHNGASIWQPDINWCGGMTELRRIGALAAAHDIPVIPHGGGLNGAAHFTLSQINAPWSELFLPPPGGPKEVYQMFEETYNISRGPEGIYMRPPDRPGFGWDYVVS